MNKLMIGAGRMRRKGWLTLDADPESGADIIATVPPLPDEARAVQWDEIEMIHVIEHFYLWEARQLLREIREVLAVGGRLVIEAPNIAYAARVLCGLVKPPRGAKGKYDMWALYGDPRRSNPLYGHRWGYSPESMQAELIDAGFAAEAIEVKPAQHHKPVRDFRVEAIRVESQRKAPLRSSLANIAKKLIATSN